MDAKCWWREQRAKTLSPCRKCNSISNPNHICVKGSYRSVCTDQAEALCGWCGVWGTFKARLQSSGCSALRAALWPGPSLLVMKPVTLLIFSGNSAPSVLAQVCAHTAYSLLGCSRLWCWCQLNFLLLIACQGLAAKGWQGNSSEEPRPGMKEDMGRMPRLKEIR